MTTHVLVRRPRPDDLAVHRYQDLDPRPVTRVEVDSVWLDINGSEYGPFPASQYTFRREVPE